MLWFFHWLCLFIGGSVLFVATVCSVSAVMLYYLNNWKTDLGQERIYICRITGLCGARWYIFDKKKNVREFGMNNLMVEELVLRRSLSAISGRMPVWEIHYYDVRTNKETLISFFTKEVIAIREGIAGLRHMEYTMNSARLQQTSLYELVERATEMQKEIEKRFKPILAKTPR